MRRWLAVLLLLLLPLQSSWAAIASHCGHEVSGVSAAAGVVQHVGHHDHAGHGHAAQSVAAGDFSDSSDSSNADGAASDTTGLDHSHCHGTITAMLGVMSCIRSQAEGVAPVASGTLPCTDPLPAQPERPQWVHLA